MVWKKKNNVFQRNVCFIIRDTLPMRIFVRELLSKIKRTHILCIHYNIILYIAASIIGASYVYKWIVILTSDNRSL